jgi:hypothetical protein
MNPKLIFTGVVVLIVLIVIGGFWGGLVGKNEATNWQIKQGVGGNVTIQDKAGYYFKGFATITTYPRYVSQRWNDIMGDGANTIESIRTTFNDGGTAQISTDIRYATPSSDDARKLFHQQFGGNIANATIAVKSHLINCVKASGPLMSASENQAARKAEFTQLVENQTAEGLYAMERIEKYIELPQSADEIADGEVPRTEAVTATRLMLDDNGLPVVSKVSPLKTYGISVLQFSITETVYDPETLKQFAAKKESFLAAEKSKADKIKFAQAEMSTVAEYAQKIAEQKGLAEMEMMKQTTDAERDAELATIEAQKNVDVALLAKEMAETVAEQKKSVATIEKEAALVVASQGLEVATIAALEAEEAKKATIAQAEGKEKAIQLSGAITEKEEVLAKIAAQRDVSVSLNLSKMAAPSTIFLSNGGGEGSGQGNYFGQLMGYGMSQQFGIIPPNGNAMPVKITNK